MFVRLIYSQQSPHVGKPNTCLFTLFLAYFPWVLSRVHNKEGTVADLGFSEGGFYKIIVCEARMKILRPRPLSGRNHAHF